MSKPQEKSMTLEKLGGPVPWIGTSGFQYPEWRGKFYPEKIAPAKMLAWYAGRFSTTEINYSFRRIPSDATMKRWAAETPEHFVFSLKAPQQITHFAKLRNCQKVTNHFLKTVAALGPKLGPVLFQLPPGLHKDVSLLKDFLAALPQPFRTAFEFRHASWFEDAVFSALAEAGAALCVAGSDELATPPVATANFGYLRLRKEKYSLPALRQWARWIDTQKGKWAEVFLYFKHEEKAAGPVFAEKMKRILPELR